MKTELVEEGLQEKDIISFSYFYKLLGEIFQGCCYSSCKSLAVLN